MKLFAKVVEIGNKVTGMSPNGNHWTLWPVKFEDVNGENSMDLNVMREELPEHIKPGAEGWLMFNIKMAVSKSGNSYNAIRFNAFRAVEAANGTKPAQESHETDGAVRSTTEAEKVAQNENLGQNGGNGMQTGGQLPF